MISFAEMIQEIFYAESMLTWKIQMISAVIMNKYPTQCYLPKTVKVPLQHEYYFQEVRTIWDTTICNYLYHITINHSIIAFYTTIIITAKCSYLN